MNKKIFTVTSVLAAALLFSGCGNEAAKETSQVKESQETPAAQLQGSFTTLEIPHGKLHIYNSNDVMADASFIVEGAEGLVTLELPLFKTNAAEFDAYVKNLKKPVVQSITDYHEGASAGAPVALAENFKAFMKGPVYSGMMEGFKQSFGDSMVELPDIENAEEVPFGSSKEFAGVKFEFRKGATSDFPAASIIIDGTAYLTHWAPAKAHISHLQVGSAAAIDAEIAEAKASLASGAKYFIGGHGGLADQSAVEFKIQYLEKVAELKKSNKTAADFATALKAAFPGLPGEDGVELLANALYK